MHRILIADPDPSYANTLGMLLKDDFTIRVSCSPGRIMDDILDYSPDYLIINMSTTEFDGLKILYTMNAFGVKPAVIALAEMPQYYLQTLAPELGLIACILKPLRIQAVAFLLTRMAGLAQEKQIPLPTAEQLIRHMLSSLIGDQNLSGIECLTVLLPMVVKYPDRSLTNDYYVDTAKQLHISKYMVERRIRTLIDHAWESRANSAWYQYFMPGMKGYYEKPSNGDFIQVLSKILIAQKGQYRNDAE